MSAKVQEPIWGNHLDLFLAKDKEEVRRLWKRVVKLSTVEALIIAEQGVVLFDEELNPGCVREISSDLTKEDFTFLLAEGALPRQLHHRAMNLLRNIKRTGGVKSRTRRK